MTEKNILTVNNKLRFIQFLPGIAWFFIVLFLICMPGKDIPKNDWFDLVSFDKIVHGGIFGGLVFLFCMPFKKVNYTKQQKLNWFIKIALATIVWGITTEFIQKYLVVGRQFDMMDWAADSFGAILSYFLCRKIFV